MTTRVLVFAFVMIAFGLIAGIGSVNSVSHSIARHSIELNRY